MSKSHKNALAQGRVEGRIVRVYLEVVGANRPKCGRKRTPESITKRLAVIAQEIETEINKLESQFVKVARPYSERNDIEYIAWRELGVQPNVLKRAGITNGELK